MKTNNDLSAHSAWGLGDANGSADVPVRIVAGLMSAFRRAAMVLLVMVLTTTSAWADGLSGSGTAADPYLISSAEDWTTFANSVSGGTTYEDKTVMLTDDISITTMAGTYIRRFKGTFLGCGYTLTVNYTATTDGCAPFLYIDGATIKTLKVAGTITTDHQHAAGIAAYSYGDCTIQSCWSNVAITSTVNGDGTHGGLVAVQEDGSLNITDCLFDGSITGSNTIKCGGMVGWRKTTLTFTNCFQNGTLSLKQTSGSATFNRNSGATLTNSYYKTAYGDVQGQQTNATGSTLQALLGSGWTVSGNKVVPIIYSRNLTFATVSDVSTIYFYTGSAISITPIVTDAEGTTLTPGTDYTFTIKKGGAVVTSVTAVGEYTLTITGTGTESNGYYGSKNITFFVTEGISGSGTISSPYLIGSIADWTQFTNADFADTYWASGVCVKLTADINGITTMAGTSTNRFKGTFMGDGHTLTVNYMATANDCAPFLYIEGATINTLKVAGTISTSYQYAAGIAAHSYGNSIIQSCWSNVDITSTVNGDGTHGGLVAGHESGSLNITNCLFDGSITGSTTTDCGGFVGWRNATLTFTNCFQNGTLSLKESNGSATFNRNGGATLTNSYYKTAYGDVQGQQTSATGSDLQALLGSGWTVSGGKVVPIMSPSNIATAAISGVEESYYNSGEEIKPEPVVTAANGTLLTKNTDYTVAWSGDGKTDGTYTITVTGKGSYTGSQQIGYVVKSSETLGDHVFQLGKDDEGSFYKISSSDDLRALAAYVNAGNTCQGKRFKQTDDIDLGGSSSPFTPIGYGKYFLGTYDGGSRTVSRLYIYAGNDNCVGFFGRVENGTVRNVVLDSPDVTNTTHESISGIKVGALIGYAEVATVENCLVFSPTLNATGLSTKYIGALIGETTYSTQITNCSFYAGTGNATTGIGKRQGSNNGDVSRVYKVTLGSNAGLPNPPATGGIIALGSHYYCQGATVQLSYTGSIPNGYRSVFRVSPANTGATVTGQGVLTIGTGDITITASLSNAPIIDISTGTIADIPDQLHTGSPIVPDITLTVGGKVLTAGTDYLVGCTNNVNAGTATLTATGLGDYTGTLTKSFRIYNKTDISTGTIADIPNQDYTGSPIVPDITLTVGGKVLTAGTDYTVSCTNNVNVGTATLTATGQGNYTGTLTKDFRIVNYHDKTGSCGQGVTYTLHDADQNGRYEQLTISGTGAMTDYDDAEDTPWWDNREEIGRVIVAGGVTHIGDCAFYACKHLSSVSLSEGIISIGDIAFYGCEYLSKLTVPASVESVGEHSFYAFGDKGATLTFASGSRLKDIGNLAFECIAASVDMSACLRLTTVPIRAFSAARSNSLTPNSVIFPRSLTSIGMSSFIEASEQYKVYVDVPDGYQLSVNGASAYVANGKADITSVVNPGGYHAEVALACTIDPAHFADNGNGSYTIKTAGGWGVFCDLLEEKDKGYFTNKTVTLDANIGSAENPVTRMAGADGHDFTGTFDGNGNTLTVSYNAKQDYAAPFRYVESGCVIKNLRVEGTIQTSAKYAAGIAGSQQGTVAIRNCRSSVVIKSSTAGDGTHGGLVAANDNGTLTIEGCVFDGKLLTTGTTATTKCGGFVGYHNKGTLTITNSLYAPAALGSDETESTTGSATFVRNGSAGSHCYYTRTLGSTGNQGSLKRSITAGDSYVTISIIALSGNKTSYSVSNISAYANGGIQYRGTLCYGQGDQVSLTLSHTDHADATFKGYSANNEAIGGSGNPYTLTMPDADVAIRAIWAGQPDFVKRGDGAGTSANPYKITNADDLKDLAIYVNGTGIYSNDITETTAHDCSGVYFQQTNPITLTGDWTPIGNNSHTFKGKYNGDNKTISGLTVSGNYTSAGLFGNTYYNSSQCVLQNIVVKDCNIDVSGTDNSFAGGIVGYASDYTLISNCRVTGTVKANASAGGIAGYLWTITNGHISKISQCFADVTVAATTKGKLLGRGAGNDTYDPSVFDSKTSHYHADGSGVTAFGQGADNTYIVPVYIVKGVPSGVTVAETNASVTFNDTPYFASGATATLTVDDAMMVFKNFSVSGATYTLASDKRSATVTFGSSDATVTATVVLGSDFVENSDGSYTIKNATGWSVFCDLLKGNDQGYFTGKTVKLDDNISVTRMAGSEGHEFTGTFDGDGHTLTVSYGSATAPISEEYAAPFRYAGGIYIDGNHYSCAIKNLRVAGTIYTSAQFAAGFVGFNNTNGFITLENCRSSVIINSSVSGDGTHGGFVARRKGSYTLYIRGCLFDGEFHGSNTTKWGGFVGYRNSGDIYMYHSIFAPTALEIDKAESATFIRNGVNNYFRCYYTEDINDGKNYKDQGHRMRSITPGTDVTVGLNDSPATYYDVSDITNYGSIYSSNPGLKFGDTYYAGSGEEVSVTLGTSRTGYVATSYTVSNGGTVSGNATDGWTITMPDADVTVNATIAPDPAHFAVSGNTYTIKSAAGWGVFCDALQDNATYNCFSGKTVTLSGDIPTAEEKAAGTTAVTRMAGTSGHDFKGTFNGGGYTLTVGYEDTGDNTRTAPFAYVDGATIQNLIVDGCITDHGYRAAGFIGETGTNKSHITNCVSSLTISGDRYTSGFSIGGNVEIEGCLFNGKITGTARSGGFVGYSDSKLKITNCLFAPQSGSSIVGGTFYYNGDAGTLINCYYTKALGIAQGLGYNFTTAPINIGTAGEAYSVSGITPYTRGLLYGGRYYMTPEAVSLADNATNDVAAINSYFADVTLSGRTLWKDGAWNTLCLPFDLGDTDASKDHWFDGTPLEGATVMTLANSPSSGTGFDTTTGTLTLYFIDADRIEAGVPYIIRWGTPDNPVSGIISNPVFQGVTIDNDLNDVNFTGGSFKGTYNKLEYTTENKSILFLGEGNTLYYPQPSGNDIPTIGAFRAYFDLGGAHARQFVLNFGEETGISEAAPLNDKGQMTNDKWYTLDGVKLDGKPTKKGLYIHGGRKVAIK